MATPVTYTAGITIETNHNRGEGTLGGFARDKNGKPVLLSCSHVLFPGFEAIPQLKVYAPNYSSCCGGGDPIATPQYDTSKPASSDNESGLVGGYSAGTWTGGFNWKPCKRRKGPTVIDSHASEVDCAIATLDPGVHFLNAWKIKEGDTTTMVPIKGVVDDDPLLLAPGVMKGPNFRTAPTAQQYVRIYSANTGKLRYGTVLSTPRPSELEDSHDPDRLVYPWAMEDDSDNAEGMKRSIKQMLILPRPTPIPGKTLEELYAGPESLGFSGGDSGSWVINHQNLVVGMIIRKLTLDVLVKVDTSVLELRKVTSVGIATPIWPILEHLQLTIPAAADGWSGTVTAAGYTLTDAPVLTGYRRPGRWLGEELRQDPTGELLLDLIAQHRREIRWMFTTVRPVAAAWRDLGGPTLYNTFLHCLEEPTRPIPHSINGITREKLVDIMLPLLMHYGSRELRQTLNDHHSALVTLITKTTTMGDVPGLVDSLEMVS